MEKRCASEEKFEFRPLITFSLGDKKRVLVKMILNIRSTLSIRYTFLLQGNKDNYIYSILFTE